jgi:hypothetical protein
VHIWCWWSVLLQHNVGFVAWFLKLIMPSVNWKRNASCCSVMLWLHAVTADPHTGRYYIYSATSPTVTHEIHRLVISRQQEQYAGPARLLNFVTYTRFCASCHCQLLPEGSHRYINYKATFLVAFCGAVDQTPNWEKKSIPLINHQRKWQPISE